MLILGSKHTGLLLTGIAITCLLSCTPEEKKPQSNFLSRTYHRTFFYKYKPENLRIAIKLRLLRSSSHWNANKMLQHYYSKRDFQPFFVEHFLENKSIDSLIVYLNRSGEHGLKPAVYESPRLYELCNELQDSVKTPTITDVYLKLSEIELLATNSLFTYSKDLLYGRLNPQKLYSSRFYLKFKQVDTSLFTHLFEIKELPAYLQSVQPRDSIYQKLKNSLAWYRLHKDEYIGNMPSSFYIRRLVVNMERLRWKPLDSSRDFLLVNIPTFSLQAFENHGLAWTMRVCVGQRNKDDYYAKLKAYTKSRNIDDRPQNHQTPLLSSAISSIQLNPRWSVPVSIMQNEIYYHVRKNPNYLAMKNYKLYRKNKPVGRVDTIDWSRIKRDHIPFSIKQDAGDFNALGKLKFTFPNPYSIYLHDTPNKSAFTRDKRDVSHGCVRVQEPLKLAAYLTRFNDKNTLNRIYIGIGMKPIDSSAYWKRLYQQKLGARLTSSTILLKKKIPLFIQYYTCWIDNQGQLTFPDDLYQLDPTLEAALQKSFQVYL